MPVFLCLMTCTAGLPSLLLTSPAEAAQLETTCEIRFHDGDGNSEEDMLILQRHRVAEICHDRVGKVLRYYPVRPVLKKNFDVCLFEIEPEVDVAQASIGIPFLSTTRTYMLVAEGACPRQNDQRYVEVYGVSEGLFVEVLDFVKTISSSAQELEDAVLMSATERAAPRVDFDQFRIGLLDPNPATKLHLNGIGLAEWYTRGEASGYELFFVTQDRWTGWMIQVDLTADGLKIFSCERIIR